MKYLAFLFVVVLATTAGAAPLVLRVPVGSSCLGQSLKDMEATKGKGEYNYAVSAEGKTLTDVDYSERWFGLPDPVNAQYILSSDAEPKIIQITLGFKDDVSREAIIEAVTDALLDKGEQGPSGPDAPSKYYAQWVHEGVRYDFQDYGDYREMYIAWARFSYAEQWKLKEPIYVMDETTCKVKPNVKQNKVMLLASFDENKGSIGNWPYYENLWVYVCEVGHEERGALMTLPEELQHGSGVEVHWQDQTGDGIREAMFMYSGGLVLVGVSEAKATVLYSTKEDCSHVSGHFLDGEKAEITYGDPGRTEQIDLHGRYGEDVYKHGKLQHPVNITCGGKWSLNDTPDTFKQIGLTLTQAISGIDEHDVIAMLHTTYKSVDGKIRPVETKVGPPEADKQQ